MFKTAVCFILLIISAFCVFFTMPCTFRFFENELVVGT